MARVPNILTTLLFLAVSITFHLSSSSFPATFGVNAAAAAEEEANNNTTSSNETPTLLQQREDACFDRSPHCVAWSGIGECRKKNGRLYMKDNCPFSCNLCNPLLEVWIPRGSNPLSKQTVESQSSLDFQIYTGVAQKIDFSDSPIKKYALTGGTPHERQTPASAFDHHYIAGRIRDILASQSTYLDGIYHDNKIGNELVSSIDVDKMEHFDMKLIPVPEKCINRHPFCASWAVKGYCDSKVEGMMKICAPICHCESTNIISFILSTISILHIQPLTTEHSSWQYVNSTILKRARSLCLLWTVYIYLLFNAMICLACLMQSKKIR
jgi:hypothetical protein